MLEQALLFLIKHPALKITIRCLGIDHELQYDDIPKECKAEIESSNILLHEGNGETVFVDPFSTPYSCKTSGNSEYYNWIELLDQDEQKTAQMLLDHYCKNVKGSDFAIPSITDMRFWAMHELALHFSYFARGQEVDYTLHHIFSKSSKKVISLDAAFITERLSQALKEESKSLQGTLDQISLFKELLAEISTYFATGKLNSEYDEIEEDINLRPEHNNFNSIIEYAYDFAAEDPAYIPDRNEKWMNILEEVIESLPADKKIELSLVCGCVHLPDLFLRLLSRGCSIDKIIDGNPIPLEQATISLIHSFKLQQKAYETLKQGILENPSASIAPTQNGIGSTLILHPNTYSGGTKLTNGPLIANNNTTCSGTLVLNGGTLLQNVGGTIIFPGKFLNPKR